MKFEYTRCSIVSNLIVAFSEISANIDPNARLCAIHITANIIYKWCTMHPVNTIKKLCTKICINTNAMENVVQKRRSAQIHIERIAKKYRDPNTVPYTYKQFSFFIS